MMLAPFIGAAMLVVTAVVESVVIAVAAGALERAEPRLSRLPRFFRLVAVMSPLSLWLLFVGVGSAIWLWATLLIELGEFDAYLPAVYFTSVSATTLGYGDSVLSSNWQLLSGFIAANGLLLFSLNTAFLFEALRRMNDTEQKQ